VDERPGLGVAPAPRASRAHAERPKATKLDLVAPRERGSHAVDDRIDNPLSFDARHLPSTRDLADQARPIHRNERSIVGALILPESFGPV
jgi:hypothetical protein